MTNFKRHLAALATGIAVTALLAGAAFADAALIYDGGGSSSGQSGQGVVPFLPLSELSPRRQAAPAAGQPQQQSGATR